MSWPRSLPLFFIFVVVASQTRSAAPGAVPARPVPVAPRRRPHPRCVVYGVFCGAALGARRGGGGGWDALWVGAVGVGMSAVAACGSGRGVQGGGGGHCLGAHTQCCRCRCPLLPLLSRPPFLGFPSCSPCALVDGRGTCVRMRWVPTCGPCVHVYISFGGTWTRYVCSRLSLGRFGRRCVVWCGRAAAAVDRAEQPPNVLGGAPSRLLPAWLRFHVHR